MEERGNCRELEHKHIIIEGVGALLLDDVVDYHVYGFDRKGFIVAVGP